MRLVQLGANQTLLKLKGLEVLFSYETPVAGYQRNEGYFRTDTKHSPTTSRHINKYIGAHSFRTVPQASIELLLELSNEEVA